jgi:formylglycine-generating enzyme
MDLSLLQEYRATGDPRPVLELAHSLESEGRTELVASALDRAWGLDPQDEDVTVWRCWVLDSLAVDVDGLRFRYIPAGPFLMGCGEGDPDERPVHRAKTKGFWLSETPVSWADFCRVMGWEDPPMGVPSERGQYDGDYWHLGFANEIRLQYCEDETVRALDWHYHCEAWCSSLGVSGPPRRNPENSRVGFAIHHSQMWVSSSNLTSQMLAGIPLAGARQNCR